MSPTFVRRFDLVIELPLPNKEQRCKLLKRHRKSLLDKALLIPVRTGSAHLQQNLLLTAIDN